MDAPQKNLVLILSRQLASNLATPMFLIDPDGTLVFYNEPAEEVIGRPFEQVGEMPVAEWAAALNLENPDGSKLSRTRTPPGIALLEHRPAHRTLTATTFDGRRRLIEVTAYPLFSKRDEFAGVVAIFWESGDRGEA